MQFSCMSKLQKLVCHRRANPSKRKYFKNNCNQIFFFRFFRNVAKFFHITKSVHVANQDIDFVLFVVVPFP